MLLMLSAGILLLSAGIPVVVMFHPRWLASIEYENHSTKSNCTVLEVALRRECGDETVVIGYRWTYRVLESLCENELIKTDDTCNSHPLSVNLTRHCYVHNSCDSFKWNHHTEQNRNLTLLGLGITLGGVLILLPIVLSYLNTLVNKYRQTKTVNLTGMTTKIDKNNDYDNEEP